MKNEERMQADLEEEELNFKLDSDLSHIEDDVDES